SRAGQQEVGNIGAGNEQHERDGGKQHEQWFLRPAQHGFTHRLHERPWTIAFVDADKFRLVWMLASKVLKYLGRVSLSLRDLHAGFESGHDGEEIWRGALRVERHRSP